MPLVRLLILIAGLIPSAYAHPKRVLILYSTGGHSTAAQSIEALLKQYPEEFEVIRKDFADELSGFAKWFYSRGYDFISREANWLNKWGTRQIWTQSESRPLFASERSTSNFNQPAKIRAYVEETNPDVIIATHFSIAETLASLRERGYLENIPIAWTHLDMTSNIYFKQIGDQLDMSFVPTEDMRKDWSKTIDSNRVMSTGIPIMPDMMEKREPSNGQKNVSTILLMGGSMGTLSYIPIIKQIIAAFNAKGVSRLRFIAVCGRNKEILEKIKLWSTFLPDEVSIEATGFINARVLRQLQSTADLVISKPGGLTTFELMTSDRPIILTEPIGLQEYDNAHYIDRQGAGIFLPKPSEVGYRAFELLMTSAGRRQVENQKRIRSSFRLERIVEWTRTAQVTQPSRPKTTVYSRIYGPDPRTSGLLRKAIETCEQFLTSD